MSNWQSMDTAPRDGRRIVVCDEYGIPTFVTWYLDGWRCQQDPLTPRWQPSFWYPLPRAPNAVLDY